MRAGSLPGRAGWRLRGWWLCLLLLGQLTTPLALAQPAPGARLTITGIDKGQFPELGVNVVVTDAQSRRLNRPEALRLRENGVPVADLVLTEVVVGLDLIFVLDPALALEPEAVQEIEDSLLLFAGRYMEAGQDRVSLLTAGRASGRWLLENSSDPTTLLSGLASYEPPMETEADLRLLLEQALARADEDSEDRFQAVVLFSDGAGLGTTAAIALAEQAAQQQTPFFVVMPGEDDVPEALLSLTVASRGIAMALEQADEIYERLANNGTQVQLRYQSNLRSSGQYPINVTWGEQQATFLLDLQLAAPVVQLSLPHRTIRRVGTGPDSALADLQPATQPVTATLHWPDGIARQLTAATLLVDGEEQQAPVVGDAQALQFEWSLASLDGGSYGLTVQVADILGFTASSDPFPVLIEVERPAALPTPVPTPTPVPAFSVAGVQERLAGRESLLLVGGGGALFLLLLMLGWRHRQHITRSLSTPFTTRSRIERVPPGKRAWLEGERMRLALEKDDVLLGSDSTVADLVLVGPGVARLHARIRQADGVFWLEDEGGAAGTYLNTERLGLAPRRLAANDLIELGGTRFYFRVEK